MDHASAKAGAVRARRSRSSCRFSVARLTDGSIEWRAPGFPSSAQQSVSSVEWPTAGQRPRSPYPGMCAALYPRARKSSAPNCLPTLRATALRLRAHAIRHIIELPVPGQTLQNPFCERMCELRVVPFRETQVHLEAQHAKVARSDQRAVIPVQRHVHTSASMGSVLALITEGLRRTGNSFTCIEDLQLLVTGDCAHLGSKQLDAIRIRKTALNHAERLTCWHARSQQQKHAKRQPASC